MTAAIGFVATDEQRRIIEDHPLEAPAIVDAGAGTGKTEVIVQRVLQLVSSGRCAPDQILLLTFANKAAAELRRRVREKLGPQSALPHCSTFHSFAWEILLEFCYLIGISPDSTVADEPEARLFFRRAFDAWLADRTTPGVQAFPLRPLRRLEICDALFKICNDAKSEGTTRDLFRTRALRAADEFAKIPYRELRQPNARGTTFKALDSVTDERLASECADERARVEAASALFDRYQRVLDEAHVFTYADLLDRGERALRSQPSIARLLRARYRHCVVDEYQDTDAGQHRFLMTLFPGLRGVVAVGDVRQSIYGFRGARPENVTLFKSAPGCLEYTLTLNRRSVQEILDLAAAAIPTDAPDRRLIAHRGGGAAPIIHLKTRWAKPGESLYADASRAREAEYVAASISSLLAAGRAPREIAVLSRNKTKVQPLTNALSAAGIPFQLVGGVGFYDAPEVLDAVAWMRLLADPFDAQALARAAACPGIGISDAALAGIVAGSERDASVFARRLLVEDLPGTLVDDDRSRVERLRTTLDRIEPFVALPLSVAFDAVMDLTGLRASWERSGDPRAPQALANLRKLGAVVRDFCQELPALQAADFVLLLRDLERIEIDEREAGVGDANAVSILTVHAAKGLEWPIVFVTGVWPENKARTPLWVDTASGALICREGADGAEPFHSAAVRLGADGGGIVPRDEEKRADPERDLEEQRLFYVALTRARDELFITGLRRPPSKNNPDGSTHRFVKLVEDFAKARGWTIDEPAKAWIAFDQPGNGQAKAERGATPEHLVQQAVAARVFRAPGRWSSLSFSAIQYFEQCPRRSRYAATLRLPQCAESVAARPPADADPDDLPRGSLASAGDFGRLVHRSLELWALDLRNGAAEKPPTEYVRVAVRDLSMRLAASAPERAGPLLAAVARKLAGWMPLHVEAPFALEFESDEPGVIVTGFIDLIARDPAGRMTIVDYKTGGRPATDYALQLALYGSAARRAYGIDAAAAVIVRIGDGTAAFEPVEALDESAVRARVARATAGLRAGDDTPKAGSWCWTCPYRAAPCEAYPHSARRSSPAS